MKILTYTSNSYAKTIAAKLGKGEQHARLLYREWLKKGTHVGSDPHFNNAQTLLKKIVELTDFSILPIVKKNMEHQTEKYLLKTHDNLVIEMVALPMTAGYTLCISSQVGCRMGCAFCETGKMGLLRSLSTDEILSQVYQARHGLGFDVRNIVFMGMGEPLDNYEPVMNAIRILTDANGFAFGPSRITISTSGLVDEVYRLIDEIDPAVNLAVSINAPHDEIRNRLMPINRRHNMVTLRKAMEAYCIHPRRRILAEYVLIEGKNASLKDADALAEYLCGLRVTVNLIPYNPQSRKCFLPPSHQRIEAFAKRMKEHGFLTFVRGTKGQQIMAACGQLGNREISSFRKRLFVV